MQTNINPIKTGTNILSDMLDYPQHFGDQIDFPEAVKVSFQKIGFFA